MSNNIKAAEQIESNIEDLKKLVENEKDIRERFIAMGHEVNTIDSSILQLEETIAMNEATAKYIRDTAK